MRGKHTRKRVNAEKREQMEGIVLEELAGVIVSGSIDLEAREVDVLFYSGATVARVDYNTGEVFDLSFSMEKGAADLAALNRGAPLLDSHDRHSGVRSVLGAVVKGSAKLTDEGYAARLRYSRRPEVDGVWQDVQDEVLTNVSMGAEDLELRDITTDDSKRRHVEAVSWKPREISQIPVGADEGATVRASFGLADLELPKPQSAGAPAQGGSMKRKKLTKQARKTRAEWLELGTLDADELEELASLSPEDLAKLIASEADEVVEDETAELDAAEVIDLGSATQAGVQAERTRAQTIRTRVTAANLGADFAAELIDSGASVALATQRIFDRIAEGRSDSEGVSSHVTVGQDERATRIEMATEVLLNKYDEKAFPLTQLGSESGMAGRRLMEIVERFVDPSRMARAKDINSRADLALHSTSDFPNVLYNAANKVLQRGYVELAQTFAPLVRRSTLSDFKEARRPLLDGFPTIPAVNEAGEYKHVTIKEANETLTLAEYGQIFAATRKMLVNDDLNAFMRVPEEMGKAARRMESDVVWALFTAQDGLGPDMADGNPLFDAAHANVGSGAGLAEATISELRQLIMVQQGLAGQHLNLMPEYLIVPVALLTTAERLTTTITPAESAKVNPFSSLSVIAEPRLDAQATDGMTRHYLAAGPSQMDTIEVATLEGTNGPVLSTEDTFDSAGRKFKVTHDFAAAPMNWRWVATDAGV